MRSQLYRLWKGLLHMVCCWRRSAGDLKHSWLSRHGRNLAIVITIFHVFVTAPYSLSRFDHDDQLGKRPAYNATLAAKCNQYLQAFEKSRMPDVYGDAPHIQLIEAANNNVKKGGEWSPPTCPLSSQNLAIIITYRQRPNDLHFLLSNLHPFLQRQRRHYRIFIVEQAYDELFNQGRLANIGFTEAQKLGQWDCVIFHDVDIVPVNDFNMYECGSQPRHLSPSRDDLRYQLIYPSYVGGVIAFSAQQLRKVNGYSNMYWGWGSEDDDMSRRIRGAGYHIVRPSSDVGRYKTIPHKKRTRASHSVQLLHNWRSRHDDGLSALGNSSSSGGGSKAGDRITYKVLAVTNEPLYTNITVDLGPAPRAYHEETLGKRLLSYATLLTVNM